MLQYIIQKKKVWDYLHLSLIHSQNKRYRTISLATTNVSDTTSTSETNTSDTPSMGQTQQTPQQPTQQSNPTPPTDNTDASGSSGSSGGGGSSGGSGQWRRILMTKERTIKAFADKIFFEKQALDLGSLLVSN